MDINTLLRQLADEYQPFSGLSPKEFLRAGDLAVAGGVIFSEPDPAEWSVCDGVPHGRWPVYVGVAESGHVTMAALLLAAPEVIAEAEFEDAYEDHQPLSEDIGLLWDDAAMGSLRFDGPRSADFPDLGTFLKHAEAALAAAPVPWVEIPVNPETGSNVLAFPVCADSADCWAGRDADGKLVCVLCLTD
ncbi:hypothetical protein [Streptomyces silvisoli]|uniref:SMI1/KNR4 family protein n=1 Tax=Streptomyces silvisoli TaxID=3034235 RepID=A0ABT5ZTI2_9ACTN|nr:hypothetical protein [Streptomyces silvisoli]MDF3293137.1 hypothetical protein [Streptomyces silvisoli]